MSAGGKEENVMMCDGLGLILSHHQDWWQRKGLLIAHVPRAPLSKLWLPLKDGTNATEDLYLSPEMIDLDRLAGPQLDQGVIEIDGDRIRTKAPYRRIPWVEAILGCPVRATILSGSLRAQRLVSGWDEWQKLYLRHHRGWFDALLSLTELLVERSGSRYAVVQTLMRGPTDIAEAILGLELMCVSLYEHHRELKIFLEQVTDAFLEILDEQMARITRIEGGYVNAFGVWAPGTTVRIQCDASVFLSAEQYARWFLPHDVRICRAVDYSIIHLHSGSLHTVKVLLENEHPQAIQVSLDPEPSGPPIEALLPTFQLILRHKPLMVDGTLSQGQVRMLLDKLPHDGLYIFSNSMS